MTDAEKIKLGKFGVRLLKNADLLGKKSVFKKTFTPDQYVDTFLALAKEVTTPPTQVTTLVGEVVQEDYAKRIREQLPLLTERQVHPSCSFEDLKEAYFKAVTEKEQGNGEPFSDDNDYIVLWNTLLDPVWPYVYGDKSPPEDTGEEEHLPAHMVMEKEANTPPEIKNAFNELHKQAVVIDNPFVETGADIDWAELDESPVKTKGHLKIRLADLILEYHALVEELKQYA